MPSGNATAVEVPAEVAAALGPEARPAVEISINGHKWRSRLALMRGRRLIGISAANRASAGVAEGDIVEVDLQLDLQPRTVELPMDLAGALRDAPGAETAFDRLPFGLKRKCVSDVESARSAEVRQRRIAKLVASLGKG